MNVERGQHFLAKLSRIEHDLPYSPDLLETLFRQTGEQSMASLDQIAATISKDQGLTTKILTVANSAFYGLQSQVTSVARATAVLGLGEIRNILLVLGVQSLAKGHPETHQFDLEAYWTHQLRVAVTVRRLAKDVENVPAEDMFTAGLLHDLGKLMISMHAPDDWAAISRLETEQHLSPAEAEERHFGLDHGLVGALVLKSWNLPPELTEPVNWHHMPRRAGEYMRPAALLHLCDCLVHLQERTDYPHCPTWRPTAEALHLDPEASLETAAQSLTDESVDHFISKLTH